MLAAREGHEERAFPAGSPGGPRVARAPGMLTVVLGHLSIPRSQREGASYHGSRCAILNRSLGSDGRRNGDERDLHAAIGVGDTLERVWQRHDSVGYPAQATAFG